MKDWNSEEPGTSDPTSPNRKYSDHVTLTSDAANGRTLLEIFSDTADDKAVVPYTGSGPVVLYTPKNQGLPANIVQVVRKNDKKIPIFEILLRFVVSFRLLLFFISQITL